MDQARLNPANVEIVQTDSTAQQQLDVTQDKSIVDEIIASLASAIGIAK